MGHRRLALGLYALWTLAVSVSFTLTAWAQESHGCDGTSVEYQVSIPAGEGDTQESLQQRAVAQAEREIIEKFCGSTVTSSTQVADSQVVADSISQASRGLISSLEIVVGGHYESQEEKDHPGRFINLYKLTVRAAPTRMAGADDPNFRVQAYMDKAAYNDGESGQLTVTLEGNDSAYLYIFNVSSDSSISLLFPNRVVKDNYAPPGVFYYPSAEQQEQGLKLRFAAAPGQKSEHLREYMEILATKRKLEGLSQSKIQEAINRPLSIRDAAPSTELARLLLKSNLKRDEVSTCFVPYEIYRGPSR